MPRNVRQNQQTGTNSKNNWAKITPKFLTLTWVKILGLNRPIIESCNNTRLASVNDETRNWERALFLDQPRGCPMSSLSHLADFFTSWHLLHHSCEFVISTQIQWRFRSFLFSFSFFSSSKFIQTNPNPRSHRHQLPNNCLYAHNTSLVLQLRHIS